MTKPTATSIRYKRDVQIQFKILEQTKLTHDSPITNQTYISLWEKNWKKLKIHIEQNSRCIPHYIQD